MNFHCGRAGLDYDPTCRFLCGSDVLCKTREYGDIDGSAADDTEAAGRVWVGLFVIAFFCYVPLIYLYVQQHIMREITPKHLISNVVL
eukprot:UN20925